MRPQKLKSSNFLSCHIAALLFFSSLLSTHSLAQEEKGSADSFFSPGFVTEDSSINNNRGEYFDPAPTEVEKKEDQPPYQPPTSEATVEPTPTTQPQESSVIDSLRSRESSSDTVKSRLSIVDRLRSSLGSSTGDNAPTVYLFVAGSPSFHMAPYVEQLAKLKRVHKVEIGGVYVVMDSLKVTSLRESGLFNRSAIAPLEQLHKAGVPIKVVKELPSRFDAQYSPLWVVSVGQEDHIFEGYRTTSSFFPRTGEFDPSSIPWK